MKIPSAMPRLKGYRHPRDIIAYAVWAYHRFALSTADVEDLLAERGVIVSRETIRRAVDANGDVLDILVQGRRNAKAAKRFMVKLITQFGPPRVAITDKLRSYIKPIAHQAPGADHRAHKGLNNRIEGSHRPTRRREKIIGRFKSPSQAQRFLAAHDQINTIFKPRRYRLTSISYRHARADAFSLWADYAAEMEA